MGCLQSLRRLTDLDLLKSQKLMSAVKIGLLSRSTTRSNVTIGAIKISLPPRGTSSDFLELTREGRREDHLEEGSGLGEKSRGRSQDLEDKRNLDE